MLRQHNLNQHRRNKSELMNYATVQPAKSKKKVTQTSNNSKKRTTTNTKKNLNQNTVNNLINKSSKKMNRKQILVEDIDQVPEQQCNDDFFCFGKGYTNNKFRQLEPQMQQIVEVPDTGSYSQRNTDQDNHRNNQNKQNIRDMSNYDEQIHDKFFRLSKNQEKTNATDNATIALHSHRLVNNYSRRSSNNSQRSECSQTHSTVELSRQKSKLSRSKSRGKNDSKNQLKNLRQKTAKMQKNIKMIWECMGEIWESSRTFKQTAQRNTSHMNDLSHRVFQNQKMLLDLKLDLGRKCKDMSFRG